MQIANAEAKTCSCYLCLPYTYTSWIWWKEGCFIKSHLPHTIACIALGIALHSSMLLTLIYLWFAGDLNLESALVESKMFKSHSVKHSASAENSISDELRSIYSRFLLYIDFELLLPKGTYLLFLLLQQ